jgi:sterol 3beta-glucosyltransferase
VILIVGSRGDVQPFIALAQELVKDGHHVTIATHEEHRKFVGTYGMNFQCIAGDPKALMKLCVSNDMFSVSFLKRDSVFCGNASFFFFFFSI